MNKALHISAGLTLLALLALRSIPYFEGMVFYKFWSVPFGVLPVGLVSFLVFVVLSIITVFSVIRKKRSIKSLIVLGVFPIILFLIALLPFPSYVEGMQRTVLSSVSRDELFSFARDARDMNPDWIKDKEHDAIISALKVKHLKSLSLSQLSPRIGINEKYVNVFYGSALVKHWGFLVGDIQSFPLEQIPEGMRKQVYDGVWVYHDIW